MRSEVEGRRFKMTEEGNLVKTNFEFERALLEEFEPYCKGHNLDFDTTIQKMIDVELSKYRKELDKSEGII